MRGLTLGLIIGVMLALTACSGNAERSAESDVVSAEATPTVDQATPTLSGEQVAYLEAVATAENNAIRATATARVSAQQTRAAGPTRAPRATPAPPYKLAKISLGCTHTDRYATCEGFVKNLTDAPLYDIVVVVTWLDESGTPVLADDALIDYNPVLAGQSSPWSLTARHNPALTSFGVTFKEFGGGTILTRDDR